MSGLTNFTGSSLGVTVRGNKRDGCYQQVGKDRKQSDTRSPHADFGEVERHAYFHYPGYAQKMANAIGRPDAAEYAPYYERYISLVKGEDILAELASQIEGTVALLRGIPEEKGDYQYQPGKWTIREVLGHMIDTERILAYRALRFSRNEAANLPSFDQDAYALLGPYGHCPMADLIGEFALVRKTTLCLFGNLGTEDWARRGMASDHAMTVRAAAYVTAGHELRHVDVLRERYLPGM